MKLGKYDQYRPPPHPLRVSNTNLVHQVMKNCRKLGISEGFVRITISPSRTPKDGNEQTGRHEMKMRINYTYEMFKIVQEK